MRLQFTELVGEYEATLVVIAPPREAVAAALPRGLALGEQSVTPAGTHPLLLAFGRHDHAHLTGALERLPGFPMRYLELIAAIPFTRLTGQGGYDGPYLHLARLLLDSLLPVVGGYALWGFPKEMARLERSPGRSEARSFFAGTRLASLRVAPSGSFVRAAAFPGLSAMRAMTEQPLVQRLLGGRGPALGSLFDWGWDDAEVCPAEGEVEVSRGLLRALPASAARVQGIGAGPLGACELRTRWRLSLPYPPGETPSALRDDRSSGPSRR